MGLGLVACFNACRHSLTILTKLVRGSVDTPIIAFQCLSAFANHSNGEYTPRNLPYLFAFQCLSAFANHSNRIERFATFLEDFAFQCLSAFANHSNGVGGPLGAGGSSFNACRHSLTILTKLVRGSVDTPIIAFQCLSAFANHSNLPDWRRR